MLYLVHFCDSVERQLKLGGVRGFVKCSFRYRSDAVVRQIEEGDVGAVLESANFYFANVVPGQIYACVINVFERQFLDFRHVVAGNVDDLKQRFVLGSFLL